LLGLKFEKDILECRVETFKNLAPGLPLPPKPVITRRGTWLCTVLYSNENLKSLETILSHLDEDVISINICKSISLSVSFKNDLSFISVNYGFLVSYIEKPQH